MRNPFSIIGKSMLMLLLICGAALCVQVLSFSTINDESDVDHQLRFNESYKIFSLNMPTDLDFCGERVPMELLDVRERLDRELLVNTYWQSSSLLAHKRANRWFPVIEKILKREGVPDDMKYIPLTSKSRSSSSSM